MPKIEMKGWIEADDKEPYTNIPKKCKYCNSKMRITDALQSCGLLMAWCPESTCRWCEIFKE